jgi:preprotein translocase subunit SecG
MTTSLLLIIQIVLVIIIVIAVLLQKSSSIGLGAYSGSNDSVFGAKGPNSFLAKATFTIGFIFVVNTLALGYMYAKAADASVIDAMVEDTNIVAPEVKTPLVTPAKTPTEATTQTTQGE